MLSRPTYSEFSSIRLYRQYNDSWTYGDISVNLGPLFEKFLYPLNWGALNASEKGFHERAVWPLLIVHGCVATAATWDNGKWHIFPLRFKEPRAALQFKENLRLFGLNPKPFQTIPPKPREEVMLNLAKQCPFIVPGDFVGAVSLGGQVAVGNNNRVTGFVPIDPAEWNNYPYTKH